MQIPKKEERTIGVNGSNPRHTTMRAQPDGQSHKGRVVSPFSALDTYGYQFSHENTRQSDNDTKPTERLTIKSPTPLISQKQAYHEYQNSMKSTMAPPMGLALPIRGRRHGEESRLGLESTPSGRASNDNSPRDGGSQLTGTRADTTNRKRTRSRSHSRSTEHAKTSQVQQLEPPNTNNFPASQLVMTDHNRHEHARKRHQSLPARTTATDSSHQIQALSDRYTTNVQHALEESNGDGHTELIEKMKQMLNQFKEDLVSEMNSTSRTTAQGESDNSRPAPTLQREQNNTRSAPTLQREQRLRDYPEINMNIMQWEEHSDQTLVTVGRTVNSYQRHFQAPYAFSRTCCLRPAYDHLRNRADVNGELWSHKDVRRVLKGQTPCGPTLAQLQGAGHRRGEVIVEQ